MITTPCGYECSRISSASIRAWQNGVTSRLSGADVKVRIYVVGWFAGVVQTIVPLIFGREGVGRMGTEKSCLKSAMLMILRTREQQQRGSE